MKKSLDMEQEALHGPLGSRNLACHHCSFQSLDKEDDALSKHEDDWSNLSNSSMTTCLCFGAYRLDSSGSLL